MCSQCFVTPYGPLPGSDDLHGLTAFDLLDEPEHALMFYAESPAAGEATHRGWSVPPVSGWRRKRNFAHAQILLKPSDVAQPLVLHPPSERPGCCASAGCPFYVGTALSSGRGTHCCGRCAERPGRHSAGCEQRRTSEPPPEWALAEHGTVDLDVYISIQLPVPTFLIPLIFVRWVVSGVISLVYPYLLKLNERFGATPFARRVDEDAQGFYASVAAALNDPTRPHHVDVRRSHTPAFSFNVGKLGRASSGSRTELQQSVGDRFAGEEVLLL